MAAIAESTVTHRAEGRRIALEIAAAARVVLGCVALGLVAGLAWGLLVPGVQLLVVEENSGVPLIGESAHRFDAVAIYCGIVALAGLVSVVVAWQWRIVRGPILALGLLIGGLLGAGATAVTGLFVADLRFPQVDSPRVDDIVAVAPGFGTPLVLGLQPFVVSLVLLVLALLHPADDLGVHVPDWSHRQPPYGREASMNPEDLAAQIKTRFASFDDDGDGKLTVEQFREFIAHPEEPLPEDVVDQMVAHADSNGDGLISFEEFATFLGTGLH